MCILKISDLSVGYNNGFFDQSTVLSDISVEFKKGLIYGLIGVNGAGKTTFFKTILGLIPRYKGIVQVFGMNKHEKSTQWLDRVGYVPEEALIPHHLTARRFLSIYGGMLFSSRHSLRKAVGEKLDIVELSSEKSDEIESYSKGMKKRLMIAHALLADPELLILDEPFEGIDPKQRINLKQILMEYRDRGKTVVISSHELYELQNVCDSFALLKDGSMTMYNSIEEVDW